MNERLVIDYDPDPTGKRRDHPVVVERPDVENWHRSIVGGTTLTDTEFENPLLKQGSPK